MESQIIQSPEKRILVHLHVFYKDQLDYFLDKMSNICHCRWDLYVTASSRDSRIEDKIREFKSDAHIVYVENRGYDVWPFIQVIKSVDLSEYDYVLKLHTKSPSGYTAHGIRFKGFGWRNALVDALIRSKTRFLRNMRILDQKPDVGLVCSNFMYSDITGYLPEDTEALTNEIARIGLKVNDMHFCVGTMFMARACIFRFLQDDSIEASIFPEYQKTGSVGSMAHVYERILSIAANAYGYKISPVAASKKNYFYLEANRLLSNSIQGIFSINRERKDNRKYIMLFWMKFYLE